MFQHEEVATKTGVKTLTAKMRATSIAFGMKMAVPFKLIGIGCGGGVLSRAERVILPENINFTSNGRL